MGSLKPGAIYIHERVGNVVYAREAGADPSTRQVVGWDYDKDNPNFDPRTSDGRPLIDQMREDKLWAEIRRAAKTNPTLQEAMERVKILYYLSKDSKSKTKHHPV
jgi:hypothetical protein